MSEINDSPIDEFARIYQGRFLLQQQIETSPEIIQDILKDGLETAESRLAELAADPSVRDYYTSEAAQAYEAIRQLDALAPTLQSLGMQEQVETRRREIEAKNGMALYAAGYFVGRTVEITPVDDPSQADESVDPAAGDAASDPTEYDPNKLVVLVDNKRHIQIGDQVISLRRTTGAASENEPELVRWRLDGLKFLADHKGQNHRTTDVWRAVNPGVAYPNTPLWTGVVIDFFRELRTPDGRPLVNVERKSAESKYVFCRVDLDIDFQETEDEMQAENEGVFIFNNGKAVGGATGTMLHIFSKATADQPETLENMLHLFDEEWLNTGDNRRFIASQGASMAKKAISLAGAEDQLTIHKVLTGRFHPETGRSIVGYYMEDLTKTEMTQAAEPDSRPAEPEPEAETEPESPSLSLHEATVFAAFLNHYRQELADRGIDPLPGDIYESLNSKVVETYSNGQKTNAELCRLRIRTFEKAIALIDDNEALNEAYSEYEASGQDVRADLLIWLMDLTGEQNKVIKDLLESHSEVYVSFDVGRRKGFAVVNIESKVIPNAQKRPIR